MPDKPTTAAGYKSEQVELVRATGLYVATKLGDMMDDLVIIGGLVPSLIVDQAALPEDDASGEQKEPHRETVYPVRRQRSGSAGEAPNGRWRACRSRRRGTLRRRGGPPAAARPDHSRQEQLRLRYA